MSVEVGERNIRFIGGRVRGYLELFYIVIGIIFKCVVRVLYVFNYFFSFILELF